MLTWIFCYCQDSDPLSQHKWPMLLSCPQYLFRILQLYGAVVTISKDHVHPSILDFAIDHHIRRITDVSVLNDPKSPFKPEHQTQKHPNATYPAMQSPRGCSPRRLSRILQEPRGNAVLGLAYSHHYRPNNIVSLRNTRVVYKLRFQTHHRAP